MTETTESIARRDADRPSSRLDGILRVASMVALAILIFLAGSLVTISGRFPGPQLTRAYEGGQAFYAKLTRYQDVYRTDLWAHERRKERGVTVHDPRRAQQGVTLYTAGNAAAAYLVDMQGEVLHTWERPFSTVWTPDSGGVKEPQPDSHVYFRKAHVFPNGDLIALYEGAGDTPYGYGLVKLDRDSNVIWSYFGRAHHQFDVGPDGKIYVLTHEFVEDEVDGFGHLKPPRLEDFLVVLSPEGNELMKVRLFTAVADSRYRQMLYTLPEFAFPDPTHVNTVKYIDKDEAANFAYGKEGQILLSFRAFDGIGVLDLETQKLVWGTKGFWIGQHDPDILPNGDILMFDNFGNYDAPTGKSRVVEFDPATMEIKWQYAGTRQSPLDSNIRSDQQRLPNGNTLISESDGGRILEVTPDGEIAWEFLIPAIGGPDKDLIPIVGWSQRLDPANLDPSLLQPAQQTSSVMETSE